MRGGWVGRRGEADFEVFVDAEADGGVGELPEEGGAEAGVEAEGAFIAEDVGDGGDAGFGGIREAGL